MPRMQTWLATSVCVVWLASGAVQAGDKPAARVDCFGDPLPPGVLARLGTERFSHCYCAAFSPDGKSVATAGSQFVYLWDANTGKELRRLPCSDREVAGLAFSPDGQKLAALDFSATTIYLWDLKTFQSKTLLQGGFGGRIDWAAAAVFSGDSKTLYAATADAVFHWDTSSGAKLKHFPFQREGKPCRSPVVVFAPDGKTVATETNGQVVLWEVQTGKFKHQLKTPKGYFTFRFSPDGKILATAGGEYTRSKQLALWDVVTGNELQLFKLSEWPDSVSISPDGKTLASASEQSIQIWNLSTPKQPARVIPALGINSVQFSPDGKMIAWRCCEQTLRFLDLTTGQELHALPSHRGAIRSVAFSQDSNTLATGSADGSARVWDTGTGKQLRAFQGHQAKINAVALSPDGKQLVSASSDNTAIVWELATGKKNAILEKHGNEVLAAAFSPNGTLLATGGYGPCMLWDPVLGKNLFRGRFPAASLVFTPDGNTLVSGTHRMVFLLDVSKKKLRELPFSKDITSLAISRDGTTLAVGCEEKLFVVDVASEKTKKSLPGHFNRRGSVAFSPDGRYLASGGDGYGRANPHKTTQIFELLTGTEIHHFKKSLPVYSVAFSPDGTKLATGSADATALIWDLKNLAGKQCSVRLTPKELTACWLALTRTDANFAYEARVDLLHAPESAVPFLAERLRPVAAVDQKQVAQWIHDLGHNQFNRRETARQELEKLAELVEAPLRDAQADKLSLETQRRIETILAKLDAPVTPDRLRELRSIEILEHIGTAEAGQLLKQLAKGNPASQLTRQAQLALERKK